MPEEVASLLRSIGASLKAELGAVPEDLASWHPAEGEWSIKECLGHVIETEAHGFAGRIRRILAEPGVIETGWDQARVQADRQDDRRPLEELVEAFAEMRAESVKLVDGLMNTDLSRACFHEQAGELHIEDLLHEWVHHDRNHYRQMLANVQAFVWPAMGNARNFSDPTALAAGPG
jgi:hypothetical protein